MKEIEEPLLRLHRDLTDEEKVAWAEKEFFAVREENYKLKAQIKKLRQQLIDNTPAMDGFVKKATFEKLQKKYFDIRGMYYDLLRKDSKTFFKEDEKL